MFDAFSPSALTPSETRVAATSSITATAVAAWENKTYSSINVASTESLNPVVVKKIKLYESQVFFLSFQML